MAYIVQQKLRKGLLGIVYETTFKVLCHRVQVFSRHEKGTVRDRGIYTYLLFLSLLELSQFLAVPELSVLVPGLQNGATPGPVLANALLPLLVPPLSFLCRQHMWSCVTIPGGTHE